MALIGRLHPLLVHFPIALVIAAALAEATAAITGNDRWRAAARNNVRAGAVFAVLAAVAGWRLALGPEAEPSPLLEWHRWLGIVTAVAIVAAALTTADAGQPKGETSTYRVALFAGAVLVGVTAHLGGALVWGANFLRP
jgi:uncharacterized membrane protein